MSNKRPRARHPAEFAVSGRREEELRQEAQDLDRAPDDGLVPEAAASTDSSVDQGADTLAERDWLIAMLIELVKPLGEALPITSEVVLHDLRKLPDSIIAVHGEVTGRQIGHPATDLLLQRATTGDLDHMVGYSTKLQDGRQLRSTTMIIRDSSGTPIACICINSDLTMWRSVSRIASAMVGDPLPPTEGLLGPSQLSPLSPAVPLDIDTPASPSGPNSEVFVRDVDELASHLVSQAMAEQGIPVELMKKEHKLAVVQSLKARGMFMLRDAVEMIATSLHVTRFTIYNYLNELEDEQKSGSVDQRNTKRKARNEADRGV